MCLCCAHLFISSFVTYTVPELLEANGTLTGKWYAIITLVWVQLEQSSLNCFGLVHRFFGYCRRLRPTVAMDKLKYTLLIWNKLSTHVRVRDRSIKILQYGCQMLIGFYGNQLTKVSHAICCLSGHRMYSLTNEYTQEMSVGLRMTRSMASTSRKAFWLLKSVNHVQALIHMIENYEHTTDECYADLVDILEQVFLIMYYFYENLVFMARTKLVSFTEDTLDGWGNVSWFMEDLAGFVAAFLRTYIKARKLRIRESAYLLAHGSAGHSDQKGSSSTYDVTGRYGLTKEIRELKTQYSDSLLALTIVSGRGAVGVVFHTVLTVNMLVFSMFTGTIRTLCVHGGC